MRNLLLLAVLLLAACSSAPISTPTPSVAPDPTPTPATPAPTEPPGAEWRVLARDLWLPETPFAVAAARSPDELATLWSALSQAGQPPTIDFATEMVLYLGTSGSSSCPEELVALNVDMQNARVHGMWHSERDRPCTDDLAPQGVLIAVERGALPDQPFVLTLREQLVCPDCPSQPDQLLVDPTAS